MADDTYSEQETVMRREAALTRMLNTPPKPYKQPKSKDGKSATRKRV